MLRLALSLRFVMLVASAGAGVGALMMFWEGGADLAHAAGSLVSGDGRQVVITSIMHGVDAFLFGIVLVIFAFGFVFGPSLEGWRTLPSWMQVSDISELKNILVEVILLYLLVDVATDWADPEHDMSWTFMVKPLSILAIAAAFGILKVMHSRTVESTGSSDDTK